MKNINTLMKALLIKNIFLSFLIEGSVLTCLCDFKSSKEINLFNKNIEMAILYQE